MSNDGNLKLNLSNKESKINSINASDDDGSKKSGVSPLLGSGSGDDHAKKTNKSSHDGSKTN